MFRLPAALLIAVIPAPAAAQSNRIASLLADGQVVFGIFSGEKTPETARRMAGEELADFVFYSLESGPFDLDTMAAYQAELDPSRHPLALRIPPIRDGRDEAAERTAAGLAAGAHAIVFPHVESADEARHAVASMGGAGVSMLLIEDRVGVENAAEIVSVPGVTVAFPGPGDLRRAYEGDLEAVEAAIQTVLAACLEAGTPCGITAGPDDIAARIEQGFRVFIVTSPEALAVGHRAAGR